MRRTHAIATIVIFILTFLIFATVIRFHSNELLRRLFLYSIENAGKGAIRRSGAQVSLHAASLSFGCNSNRDGKNRKVDDGGGRSGRCWNFELRHLHISNVPVRNNGDDKTKDWLSPYAVHLDSLNLSVSGPLAYLSVLQIPIARSVFDSPSFAGYFCNGLEFVVGFRVLSIDILEIVGLTIYVEEDEGMQGGGEISNPEEVIKSGLLQRLKGIKHHRQYQYEFILEPHQLRWFEQFQKQDEAATSNSSPKKLRAKRKMRGSIRLFASSSVEIIGDQLLELELVSDTDHLVLLASSIEERDAWVNAISRAIAGLQTLRNGGGGGGYSNSPWIDELVAESNARKVRWQQREKRQRYQWQLQWQSTGRMDDDNDAFENESDETGIDGDDNFEGGERKDDEEDDEVEGRNAKSFLSARIHNLHSTLERRGLNTFENSLEWRIGQLSLHGLDLHINERRWIFDGKDWLLRGFFGSSKKLRRRLKLEVGPKLLLDSSGRVISGYTGKEGYVFGDLTVATVTKMGIGVADSVQRYTGKQEYDFGDLSKATVNKMGAGVADAVQGFTGKEQYVFGDVSKAAVNKMGTGVADAVQGFTGKEQYVFGDVTKAVLSKFKPRRSKVGRHQKDESNISMRVKEL